MPTQRKVRTAEGQGDRSIFRVQVDGKWGSYVGDVNANGTPHGRGTMTWDCVGVVDQMIEYDGDFSEGELAGLGKLSLQIRMSTQVVSSVTRCMEKDFTSTQIVMSMKEFGLTTRVKAEVY